MTMRKLGVWGLGAALAVGLGAAALTARADDKDDGKSTSSPGFLGKLFGSNDKPAPKKPEPKVATAEKPKPAVKSVVETAAAERKREEQVLLRRQEVVKKLYEIAVQKNDMDMFRQVQELDEKAFTAYNRRIAHLPASAATIETDEQILERKLGTAGAPPAQAVLLPLPGSVREPSNQAAREDKP
jgi:hypothetical protein